MALTSAECWDMAQQTIFQKRVRYTLNKVAIGALSEAAATPGHAARVEFAKKVLAGSYSLEQVAMAIFSNDALKASGNLQNTTTGGVTDAELLTAISGLFSALAGFDAGV